jgi:hypothetical protein
MGTSPMVRSRSSTRRSPTASIGEKLQSIFYLFFGVATLFVGWLLWTRRVYTFEPSKVTVVVGRPFQRATQEIGADRITAIADHNVFDRRRVELKLAGASPIPVVEAGRTETLVADPLAKELAEFLGKPLESVST